MLKLGYNTCGFSHDKDIARVIEYISEIGYHGIELTLDRNHFHPCFCYDGSLQRLTHLLASKDLVVVINLGGRYVLSDRPHEPSLISAIREERDRFVRFAIDAIELAPKLSSHVVMLHSGLLPPPVSPDRAWGWMVAELQYLTAVAEEKGVCLAFEFHPAMLVSNLADYRFLREQVGSSYLKLTLDVGHVVCSEDRPVGEVIRECQGEVVNVHLEDIKGREHFHLPIGQGDIDFRQVFEALKEIEYRGLINVEYNSHDLDIDQCLLARKTFDYLQGLM
ncbi:MAG: sugar phosphate isomerase/epimerase family protein [Anaerolineae bacterium]